jgi:hypothetical protein
VINTQYLIAKFDLNLNFISFIEFRDPLKDLIIGKKEICFSHGRDFIVEVLNHDFQYLRSIDLDYILKKAIISCEKIYI